MLTEPSRTMLYSREDAAMLIDMPDAPGQPNVALLKACERCKNRVADGSPHTSVARLATAEAHCVVGWALTVLNQRLPARVLTSIHTASVRMQPLTIICQ